MCRKGLLPYSITVGQKLDEILISIQVPVTRTFIGTTTTEIGVILWTNVITDTGKHTQWWKDRQTWKLKELLM